jgi:hypothetical protein
MSKYGKGFQRNENFFFDFGMKGKRANRCISIVSNLKLKIFV